MNRKIVLLAYASILLLSCVGIGFQFIKPVIAATTWTVDDDGPADYSTIQEAINVASNGDTIFVSSGIYFENVVVNKTISLIGQNKAITFIDGNNSGTVISLEKHGSVFKGFTVRNSGQEHAGIDLSESCIVSRNNINNTYIGLLGGWAKNNIIANNSVTNTHIGLKLWSGSDNNTICGNELSNNVYGIILYRAKYNFLRNNTLTSNEVGFSLWPSTEAGLSQFINDIDSSNTIDGKPIFYLINKTNLFVNKTTHTNVGYLAIINSSNTKIEDLELTKNGLLIAYSNDTFIRHFTVKDITDPDRLAPGILFFNSRNCTVHSSVMTNNKVGLYAIKVVGFNIVKSEIRENTWSGIQFEIESEDVVVKENLLTNNHLAFILGHTWLVHSNVKVIDNVFLNSTNMAMWLRDSQNCTIRSNKVLNNVAGISLDKGKFNLIQHNDIFDNANFGIRLDAECENNTIIRNNLESNKVGLLIVYSNSNRIYQNNFINNVQQVVDYSWSNPRGTPSANIWDNGYPSGGNYWSDYEEKYPHVVDENQGENQDISGSDGIWDHPYVIDENNQDNYPLVNPWKLATVYETSVKVKGKNYPVTIESNTTLEQIVATSNTLHFKSSGPTGQTGYILVIFPMVNTTDIKVFIDGGPPLTPPPFPIITSNGTHYFIYFEFTLSVHDVAIQFAPLALPPPVGGEWTPVNKFELLAPWIGLASLLTVATVSIGYVKHRKKKQN